MKVASSQRRTLPEVDGNHDILKADNHPEPLQFSPSEMQSGLLDRRRRHRKHRKHSKHGHSGKHHHKDHSRDENPAGTQTLNGDTSSNAPTGNTTAPAVARRDVYLTKGQVSFDSSSR
jgi:hypothetical protein